MYKYFMILLFMACACTTPQVDDSTSNETVYFDIPKLVEKQLTMLQNSKAELYKKLEVNKKTEELKLAKVDWEKELKLFAEANINKPVLKGTYQVFEQQEGDLPMTSYQSLDDKNKVKTLIVKGNGKTVEKVEITWEDSNPIYHSEKLMTMNFEEGKLANYSIKGYQKMVADDTLFYNLSANIQYM